MTQQCRPSSVGKRGPRRRPGHHRGSGSPRGRSASTSASARLDQPICRPVSGASPREPARTGRAAGEVAA